MGIMGCRVDSVQQPHLSQRKQSLERMCRWFHGPVARTNATVVLCIQLEVYSDVVEVRPRISLALQCIVPLAWFVDFQFVSVCRDLPGSILRREFFIEDITEPFEFLGSVLSNEYSQIKVIIALDKAMRPVGTEEGPGV